MGVRGSSSEAIAPAGIRLLRTALLVAGKDLRERLRDRSALVIAFVAPFALAAIIGLAFGGDSAFKASYAVADADRGPVAAGFRDGVLAGPGLRDLVSVRQVEPGEARALVDRGEVDAAFLLPAGLSASVQQGRPAPSPCWSRARTRSPARSPRRWPRATRPSWPPPGWPWPPPWTPLAGRPPPPRPAGWGSGRPPGGCPCGSSRAGSAAGRSRRPTTSARRWRSSSCSSPCPSGPAASWPSAARAPCGGCWPPPPRPAGCWPARPWPRSPSARPACWSCGRRPPWCSGPTGATRWPWSRSPSPACSAPSASPPWSSPWPGPTSRPRATARWWCSPWPCWAATSSTWPSCPSCCSGPPCSPPTAGALRGFVDLVADGGGLATVAAPVAVTLGVGLATGALALYRARRMVAA